MELMDLRSADGTPLTGYRWSPSDERRADVLLVHGGFEHLGRYEHVSSTLTNSGYRVTGVDLRGHGRSGGRRGHVSHWGQYVEDIRAVSSTLDHPYFIFAHSMGGLITFDHLRTAMREEVRGIVVSAPLLGIAVETPRWKMLAARALSRMFPILPMANDLPSEGVCSDPAVARAYQVDPLVTRKGTPRLYTEILRAIERVVQHQDRYETPLYMAYGTEDSIVSTEAIEQFCQNYTGDLTLRRHEGLFHEIFQEPCKDELLADAISWLDGRLPGTP